MPLPDIAALGSLLGTSTGEQRKKWAMTIIDEDIPLKNLCPLFLGEEKAVMRWLWLISDIGLQDREKLHRELPLLFEFVEKNCPAHLVAFASWWHYVGVPAENEAKAIDYLFKWFLSAEINVTMKSRSLWVLVELSKKYPDLKQELKLCLADQMDKYTVEFKKRAKKILAELEA